MAVEVVLLLRRRLRPREWVLEEFEPFTMLLMFVLLELVGFAGGKRTRLVF